MKISPVSSVLNYKAKVVSNSTLGVHKARHNEGLSKKEVAEHYNEQIKRIEAQKMRAIELQDFMQSNEVQKILDKLPKEDEVELDSLLKSNAGINGVDMIKPKKMMLYYIPATIINSNKINQYDSDFNRNKDYKDAAINHRKKVVQNDDGTIDKDGIVGWLNEIVEILNG